MNERDNICSKLGGMAKRLGDSQFLPVDDPAFVSDIELVQAEVLSKQLKTAIKSITQPGRSEIKMLVDLYYQMQATRKACREQIRSIEEHGDDENNKMHVVVLDYVLKNVTIIEVSCKQVLEINCRQSEVGRCLLHITGIGTVLAAGCLAYFDVADKQYASQFISYAGLNDNNRPWIGRAGAENIMKEISSKPYLTDDQAATYSIKTQWGLDYLRENAYIEGKGWSRVKLIKAASKIPYNASLKTLCWKIGASFQWQCNNEKSLYGKLYSARKALETERSERGEYAEQAARILANKKFDKNTEAYKAYSAGKLPKAHIIARAMRWTEKVFIVHLFECMYRVEHKNDPNGNIPPRYYTLVNLGDQHNRNIDPEVPYPC